MATYMVEVRETREYYIEVEAESEDAAEAQVKAMIPNQQYKQEATANDIVSDEVWNCYEA